jgi:hypothetical protein
VSKPGKRLGLVSRPRPRVASGAVKTHRTARRAAAGWLLIDLMIAVAILGLLGAGAWSIHGALTARGTPGHRALRVRQATELLVEAQQRALLEPLTPGEATLPSRVPGVRLTRAVTPAEGGTQRVTLTAAWDEGDRPRRRSLVTLKAAR